MAYDSNSAHLVLLVMIEIWLLNFEDVKGKQKQSAPTDAWSGNPQVLRFVPAALWERLGTWGPPGRPGYLMQRSGWQAGAGVVRDGGVVIICQEKRATLVI